MSRGPPGTGRCQPAASEWLMSSRRMGLCVSASYVSRQNTQAQFGPSLAVVRRYLAWSSIRT
eukprot:2766945-Alexandrium_andersonii.AAC.1